MRADKPTTNEIKDLLHRLDDAAQGRGRGGGGEAPRPQQAPLRLDDSTVLVEVIRWLEKWRPSETK
jgi:hypothetical protein